MFRVFQLSVLEQSKIPPPFSFVFAISGHPDMKNVCVHGQIILPRVKMNSSENKLPNELTTFAQQVNVIF